MHTDRKADNRVNRHTDRQIDVKININMDRKTNTYKDGRQSDKWINRQMAERQTKVQMRRQTNGKTDK